MLFLSPYGNSKEQETVDVRPIQYHLTISKAVSIGLSRSFYWHNSFGNLSFSRKSAPLSQ